MDAKYINYCRDMGFKPMSLGEYVRDRCNANDCEVFLKAYDNVRRNIGQKTNVLVFLNTLIKKVINNDNLFKAVQEYKYGVMDYNNLSLIRQ